jgi:hypothetical protein
MSTNPGKAIKIPSLFPLRLSVSRQGSGVPFLRTSNMPNSTTRAIILFCTYMYNCPLVLHHTQNNGSIILIKKSIKELSFVMPDPSPERPDYSSYLESSDIIDYDNSLIQDVVDQLTNGINDNVYKVRSIYEFTRDHVFHSFEINATSVTIKASEVIDQGHGTCFSKSHLLAALMRAAGIPTGFCYQVLYDTDLERLVVHGFNGVYIEELQKWVRMDSCTHKDQDDLGFDPLDEQSVRPINTNLGESDDYIIYSSPNKRIIKLFLNSDTLEDLKTLIPAAI